MTIPTTRQDHAEERLLRSLTTAQLKDLATLQGVSWLPLVTLADKRKFLGSLIDEEYEKEESLAR